MEIQNNNGCLLHHARQSSNEFLQLTSVISVTLHTDLLLKTINGHHLDHHHHHRPLICSCKINWVYQIVSMNLKLPVIKI